MNADQSLFVVDSNERRSDSMNLVWSIGDWDLKPQPKQAKKMKPLSVDRFLKFLQVLL